VILTYSGKNDGAGYGDLFVGDDQGGGDSHALRSKEVPICQEPTRDTPVDDLFVLVKAPEFDGDQQAATPDGPDGRMDQQAAE